MLYSQSSPLAEKEWLTAEDTSSGSYAPDPEGRSDLRAGRRPLKAPIHSLHPSRANDREVASDRPSLSRRMLRRLTRFAIAALIGVGVTLGWQSYGDAAKEMVIARIPSLVLLLSTSTTKPPVVATISPGPVQQLEALAFNLDVVRRSVEQLAAKQEQIAQNFAALQAIQEDIREKVSSMPPSPALQPASIPQNNPPQTRAQPPAVRSSSAPRPPAPAGPQLSR
jgi:hypothetical protein